MKTNQLIERYVCCCIILIVAAGGCRARKTSSTNITPSPTPNLTEMRRIEKLDPTTEFKKAIAEKNLKFVAVRGIGTEIPGVEGSIGDPFVQKYGYDAIEGTSDVIESKEQARLDDVARSYAKVYNKLLLHYLTRLQAKQKNN